VYNFAERPFPFGTHKIDLTSTGTINAASPNADQIIVDPTKLYDAM
jgi:hypothetical protein